MTARSRTASGTLRQVDVAIIGAGSAGISALKLVREQTDNYLLIDKGSLGTTCARVGCMPSKAFVEIAQQYQRLNSLQQRGLFRGEPSLPVDGGAVMSEVRRLRNFFSDGMRQQTEQLGEGHFLRGSARLVDANTILVDKTAVDTAAVDTAGVDRMGASNTSAETDDASSHVYGAEDTRPHEIGVFHANSQVCGSGNTRPHEFHANTVRITARVIILAVGSRPSWPVAWRSMAQRLLDSERFFELSTVPPELAVLGLGSIGLELGQACGLLGSRVFGVDMQQRLGCLSDPAAIRHAGAALADSMSLSLGHSPQLQDRGSSFDVCYADQRQRTEHVLCSVGRRDNLDHLGMDQLLAGRRVDASTLQLGELPIFVAGDSAGGQALLHEAIDEGQIAACNALAYPQLRAYQRRVPLQITFTQPQLATVGCSYTDLDIHSALIAEVPLQGQGRLTLAGGGAGVLRLYADLTGRLLGAELVSPQGEHLAHLIAAWLTAEWSVADALRQPFYHPTLQEALRSALLQLSRKLGPAYQCRPALRSSKSARTPL
jgi:dihydrolipoamide dehydrogenase